MSFAIAFLHPAVVPMPNVATSTLTLHYVFMSEPFLSAQSAMNTLETLFQEEMALFVA